MRPRIRTIKPEVHTNEELWDAEEATKLPLFRAFVGMWSWADRKGRFEWKPRVLKTGILPYWDGDFGVVMNELLRLGFVERYDVDGKSYGWIPTFELHQQINNKEEPSRLPSPPGQLSVDTETMGSPQETDTQATRVSRVSDANDTRLFSPQGEGKGREGNGTVVDARDHGNNSSNGISNNLAKRLQSRKREPGKAPLPRLDPIAEPISARQWFPSTEFLAWLKENEVNDALYEKTVAEFRDKNRRMSSFDFLDARIISFFETAIKSLGKKPASIEV